MTTAGVSNQILILCRVPDNYLDPKFDIPLQVHSKCSIINETSGSICYLVFCKNGSRTHPDVDKASTITLPSAAVSNSHQEC